MVSKANDDFPEPESPVKTINLLRGSSTVRFFRLCSRAPLMRMESVDKSLPGGRSYDSVIRLTYEHLFVGQATVTRLGGLPLSSVINRRTTRIRGGCQASAR